MRAAEADLRALAEGEAGSLRVGTFQSAGVRLLPDAMRRYVERWPGVQVRLVEAGYDDDLLGLLERGELDLAFVLANDDPAFERVPVLVDPYVLLAPSASDLARAAGPIRPREISPPAADRLPARRRACPRPSSAPAASSRRSSSARTRAASSRGSSARGSATRSCRCSASTSDADVAVLEVTGIPPRVITIAWHADRTPTPAARAFVEIVTEIGAEIAAGYAQGVSTHPERRARRETAHGRRQPAPVHQVGAPLRGAARGRDRGGRRPHRPALGPRALGRLLRGARARRARRRARPPHLGRSPRSRRRCGRSSRRGSRMRCSSTATPTRRSRAPAPRAACPSRTSRRGCGAATSRCPRSATGSRSTRSPRYLFAPDERSASDAPRARASPARSTSSAT